MQQFLVKTPREIDYSIAAAFENDYFLFLWHFWAKLVAGVAANRWNVGYVLRCVPAQSSGCFKRFGFIYISKLIHAGKLLHLFRKLFKKQIFSCIPLRRRFFVWQFIGFMHLSGSARGIVVYQYTWKKFAKIPKIHPNIPKIIPRYTLYLKLIYRIPVFKLQYTVYPI